MRDKEILHSWKEISKYLDKDRKTCFRWEKELGLPIHRIDQDSLRSNVFAYKSEIDKWLNEKANHIELKKRTSTKKKWVIPGLVSVTALLLIVSAVLYFTYRTHSSSYPKDLTIAVFPFENSNFSEHEQYIPEGIRNFISSSLSRVNNLRVIPSTVLDRHNDSYKESKF